MAEATTTEQTPQAIDPGVLGDFMDQPYAEIRARGRELLGHPEFTPVDPEISATEYREETLKRAKLLADEGQTTLGLPAELGGGGNIGGSIAAFETLAFGDLSLLVKTGVQFGLWGGAVLQLGTERHHQKYLPGTASLEIPGCFAMSETGHGSDVQSVQTTATYDLETQEFVINTPTERDRKDWIGNAAAHARYAAVFAQLIIGAQVHGVHAFVVPIRNRKGRVIDRVRIEDCGHKMGLNGVDNGRLYFDHLRVPRENLLDRYASVAPDGSYSSPIESDTGRFFTMVGTLVQGRVSVAGAGLSVSKVALTTAIRHGLRRRQFGPPESDQEVPLLDYRAHQRRLFPLLARTYALHFIQREMVRDLDKIFGGELDDPEARRELETRAAGIKAYATWHAVESIQAGREACGGIGFLTSSGYASRKDDAEIFVTFEGDNTVLLQLVAKSLLTGYREEFGNLDPLGMAGFVAAQVIERFVERSAARELWGRIWDDITPNSEEEDDLANRGYQLALFAWREDHILSSAARRIKGGIDDGYDAFTVFNAAQDHVLVAARSHIDRQILEAFNRGVDDCHDESLKPMLDRLCDLYALTTIEQHRGWYQEHGRISSTRSKAVIRSVNRLCDELRPHAEDLVTALRVPDWAQPEYGPNGLVG